MAIQYGWLDAFPDQITSDDYAQMPEEFSRTIEVIDGHIVKCESPSRVHNRVALDCSLSPAAFYPASRSVLDVSACSNKSIEISGIAP